MLTAQNWVKIASFFYLSVQIKSLLKKVLTYLVNVFFVECLVIMYFLNVFSEMYTLQYDAALLEKNVMMHICSNIRNILATQPRNASTVKPAGGSFPLHQKI